MVKLLFLHFRVTNSRLIFSLRVTNSMGELLFFYLRVTNVKLINEKKTFKYYSSNACERLEIGNTP